MKFVPLRMNGLWLVVYDVHQDSRGLYCSTVKRERFEEYGLNADFKESGWAHNPKVGTVRGLHYQHSYGAQAKLIRCSRGEIMDMVVDLRPDSVTFLEHRMIHLESNRPFMLYVAEGLAHGYQTMENDTTVEYNMTQAYMPEFAAGVRYNDPAFGMTPPLPVTTILQRDLLYPDFVVKSA